MFLYTYLLTTNIKHTISIPAFEKRLLVPKATAVITVDLCFSSTALATVTKKETF